MSEHKPVESWLTDMDGVLVHEERAIPGASAGAGDLDVSTGDCSPSRPASPTVAPGRNDRQ